MAFPQTSLQAFKGQDRKHYGLRLKVHLRLQHAPKLPLHAQISAPHQPVSLAVTFRLYSVHIHWRLDFCRCSSPHQLPALSSVSSLVQLLVRLSSLSLRMRSDLSLELLYRLATQAGRSPCRWTPAQQPAQERPAASLCSYGQKFLSGAPSTSLLQG